MRRLVPPPALGALLLLALLLGLAWTLVTPPWQSPDENSHFGYVQHLVETGEIPGDPDRPSISTEQATAATLSGADQAAAQELAPMELRPAREREYERVAREFGEEQRSDGGGLNPAAFNPPLYYLSVAPAYLVFEDASVFTRLWAMRVLSLGWLLLSVLAGWLLARELFGPDPVAKVAIAGLAGLAPMTQFIGASVTPDAALYPLWTLALAVGVRLLRLGATPRRAAALGVLVGLAVLTKATSYVLVPAAGAALLAAAWRSRSALPVLVGAAVLAVTVAPWFLLSASLDRPAAAQVGVVAGQTGFQPNEFASYLWQYYLPRLPFMTEFRTVAETLPAYDLLIKGSFGQFGWLEVQLPEWVYVVVSGAVLLTLGTLLVQLVRRRRLTLPAAYLALLTVGLLAALHLGEYPQLKGGATNFIQGRYLLPLVGVAGAALVQATRGLPEARRRQGIGALLGLLLVVDAWGLWLTLERFHA